MNDVAPPQKSSDETLWIVLSHVGPLLGVGFILPLIIYLVKKNDSPTVADHAREALNFQLSMLIYSLLCIPLVFVVVGVILLPLIGLTMLICAIIAAIQGADGKFYRYPVTIRMVR